MNHNRYNSRAIINQVTPYEGINSIEKLNDITYKLCLSSDWMQKVAKGGDKVLLNLFADYPVFDSIAAALEPSALTSLVGRISTLAPYPHCFVLSVRPFNMQATLQVPLPSATITPIPEPPIAPPTAEHFPAIPLPPLYGKIPHQGEIPKGIAVPFQDPVLVRSAYQKERW